MLRDFLRGVPRGFIQVFKGYNGLWHLCAIALTALLVLSGFDWWYYEATRDPFFRAATMVAGITGFFVPVLAPVLSYVVGKYRKRKHLQTIAVALAQAGILGWFISSLYKSLTGRIQPEVYSTSGIDISHYFNFGFWEHGIFWGWPSSHTAVAFAMSVALILLVPRMSLLRFSALVYAFFIGLGVSFGIHWFSDFVAGAIIGSLVGVVVARPLIKK